MSFAAKTGRFGCWGTSACASLTAFCAVVSDSPTPFNRTWKAGTVAFLVLLSGWLWSMQPVEKTVVPENVQ